LLEKLLDFLANSVIHELLDLNAGLNNSSDFNCSHGSFSWRNKQADTFLQHEASNTKASLGRDVLITD
jgi:hypothetical protein